MSCILYRIKDIIFKDQKNNYFFFTENTCISGSKNVFAMQTDLLSDLCPMRKSIEDPGAARPQKGDVSDNVLSRYANVLTDSVFKKIFGSEQNKDMLIALIEEVLPGRKIFRKIVRIGGNC